jgi:hypothetical protein
MNQPTKLNKTPTELDNWLTVNQTVMRYPQFTKNQLKWQLRDRASNGMDNCVKKLGKRLYIHIPKFSEWMAKGDAHG